MEAVEGILSVAQTIYGLCEQASCNKKQCKRLTDRIKILMVPVDKIKSHPDNHQSKDLFRVLKELRLTMRNARDWVSKYTQMYWWKKLILANGIKEEFEQINDRLGDAAEGLSLMLQVDQQERFLRFFQEKKLKRQNANDAKEDLQEIKNLFENNMQRVGADMQQILSLLSNTMICQRPVLTEIKKEDLTMGEQLMETESSVLYKGEYHKSTVAIKRFKDPNDMDVEIVRKIFEKEAQTMKSFSCPNILCMYGICIDRTGMRPTFSIVMEYCEKGTLRNVLETEADLSWTRRLCMSLDAARALYRKLYQNFGLSFRGEMCGKDSGTCAAKQRPIPQKLHQTDMKPFMHGSINSTKFLVDARYCVKLAGFELSKTESSLKRASSQSTQKKEANSLTYLSPQKLGNINLKYDKACEIYSFGIVLWEIATREIPLKGLAPKEIYDKVYLEKYQEPLPSDCPEELRELIDQCRAFDPTQRLCAGVIVDTLTSIVNQMASEEQEA